MEKHERQLVLDQLAASRERLTELVEGLTPEQWAFRPSEGRWSINECVEHVTRVESRVTEMIAKKLSEGGPEPEKRTAAERSEQDALIAKRLPDRTVRRVAPEPVRPTGEWPDASDLLAEFSKTRQRATEFAASAQGDLRNRFLTHPVFGEIDCYQWLVLLGLHASRHALQIEEIKAAPGFPRATASPASA